MPPGGDTRPLRACASSPPGKTLPCQQGQRHTVEWRKNFVVFEFETLLAFGVGASLVALSPLVRRYGNQQAADSMSETGRSLAKRGIKMGVAVAGVATTAAQTVARGAAEAAESFNDLVAEARAEMDAGAGEKADAATEEPSEEPATVTEVSLD